MKNSNKAFTLIELLVAILIIGILAAVAVPQYQKTIEKSKATEALSMLKTVATAERAYYLANGTYADSFSQLDVDIPWTGTTQWRTSWNTDFRSNKDWSIEINKGQNSFTYVDVAIGRISGEYKGAGFLISLIGNEGRFSYDRIRCVERFSQGIIFGKKNGAYCEKLFNAQLEYTSGTYRGYRL